MIEERMRGEDQESSRLPCLSPSLLSQIPHLLNLDLGSAFLILNRPWWYRLAEEVEERPHRQLMGDLHDLEGLIFFFTEKSYFETLEYLFNLLK